MKPVKVNSGIEGNIVGEEAPKLEGNIPLPVERVPGTTHVVSRWHLTSAEISRLLEGHDITISLLLPEGVVHPTIVAGVGVVPIEQGTNGRVECRLIDPGPHRVSGITIVDPLATQEALRKLAESTEELSQVPD